MHMADKILAENKQEINAPVLIFEKKHNEGTLNPFYRKQRHRPTPFSGKAGAIVLRNCLPVQNSFLSSSETAYMASWSIISSVTRDSGHSVRL